MSEQIRWVTYDGEIFEVTFVEDGYYIPATYDQPAEYPEIEIVNINVSSDINLIHFLNQATLDALKEAIIEDY